MVHDGVRRIVIAREAGKIGYDLSEVERLRNGHNRAEKQLLLHIRQGHIPKLLPPVADPIDSRRLILILWNGLQTADKRKERHAK